MAISTHVLDVAKGVPAQGVRVTAERLIKNNWEPAGSGTTDQDGRIKPLVPKVNPGIYRLRFDTGSYNPDGFFPEVLITFEVRDASQHYHVPLLLSPYSYSTYRGS